MAPFEIERFAEEISRLIDRTAKQVEKGTRFPGMTYEEGIRAALDWLTDREESDPLDPDGDLSDV